MPFNLRHRQFISHAGCSALPSSTCCNAKLITSNATEPFNVLSNNELFTERLVFWSTDNNLLLKHHGSDPKITHVHTSLHNVKWLTLQNNVASNSVGNLERATET